MEAGLCTASWPSQQKGNQEFKASLGSEARPHGKKSEAKSNRMLNEKTGDLRSSKGVFQERGQRAGPFLCLLQYSG